MKQNSRIEADLVLDAQPPVKIEQIDAAAQQHVLAVVDHLGVFAADRPGSGAAAEEAAGFVKIDFKSGTARAAVAARPASPPPITATRGMS